MKVEDIGDDQAWIFCRATSEVCETPGCTCTEGATKQVVECGHEVWLAQASVKMLTEHPEKFRAMCMDCMVINDELYAAASEGIFLTQTQVDELKKKVAPENVDRMIEEMGIKVIES